MPRTEKPIQPGPSRNAVDLPGSARTDHEVAPSTVKTIRAPRVVVAPAAESEVVELRDSKSRPNVGIVVFDHRGYNQRDELVISCKRSALMYRKQTA